MRATTIVCRAEAPCGGVLHPDRGLNDDLAKRGIWRQAYKCLNGHIFWTSPPPTTPDRIPRTHDNWCRTHEQYRPCSGCSDRMKRVRRRTLAKEIA